MWVGGGGRVGVDLPCRLWHPRVHAPFYVPGAVLPQICSQLAIWLVKVINMSQCVPTQVNIGERVSISQFFVAGRNKVHCMALLPVSAM